MGEAPTAPLFLSINLLNLNRFMKLSVIVPVYNEEKTIREVLRRLCRQKQIAEIVVVDDGSTDQSWRLMKKVKDPKIRLFRKKNAGKGSVIRFALTKVSGDYVLIQDADLEYDPQDISLLVDAVKNKGVIAVYGSRFLGPHSNLLFWHRLGNQFLNMVINILYNTTLSDMETCYKLLPTKMWRQLKLRANGFDIEPEVTCKLLRQNIRIFEVPISYVGRDFSEGKKITWKDGVIALWTILRWRWQSF